MGKRNLFADLTVLTPGIITSIAVACVLAAIEVNFRFSIQTSSLWFVIPAGALLAGYAGGLGYYWGWRLVRYEPSKLAMLGAPLIGVTIYFAVNYMAYTFTEIQGRSLSLIIPFETYLDLTIQNRRTSVGTTSLGSPGGFGYLLALTHLAGYALGGFLAYCGFSKNAFCKHCTRVLNARRLASGHSIILSPLPPIVESAALAVTEGRHEQAAQLVAGAGPDARWAAYRIDLQLLACEDCKHSAYELSLSKVKPPPAKQLKRLSLNDAGGILRPSKT